MINVVAQKIKRITVLQILKDISELWISQRYSNLWFKTFSVQTQKIIIEMTADFKAKKLTEVVPETESIEQKVVEYKTYDER